jgi:hypothetical protein
MTGQAPAAGLQEAEQSYRRWNLWFILFLLGIMGRIENFLLGRGGQVPMTHEPQFQQAFAVVGEDPPATAACLGRPLIDLLLADRLLTVIVEGGRLLVFRRLTYVRPEDYQAFLAQVVRIAELLSA